MASEGFLLVDKPSGWTSHDVVAKVRGLAGTKKVGHAGTLDPMATGLLVLGLGRATRLLRFVQGLPKEYVARAQLGVATDTLDADGIETERAPMVVDQQTVEAALAGFRGSISQIPPMVSAIKMGGRKLYELAREGQEVERAPRPVEIYELELTGFEGGDYPVIEFRVVCSTGTYVRTLADDIAQAVGGRGHLVTLRRARIGSLTVGTASTMESLIDSDHGLASVVKPLTAGLADLMQVTVDDELGKRIAHGSVLTRSELPIEGPTAVLDRHGNLLAVYAPYGADTKPEVVVS
ncbi:MAG: tRNA pseudouridine(55) synthase TruB [Acidimicrobiia bacterium]|nr:tRNA pseudouridine(55) synthase TruB [Acidimicrobiia bacterium]